MAPPVRYIFRQGKVYALFTIIKVLSLVIGFSVFVILISLVKDELGYDKFWENGRLLYRVAMEQYQNEELIISSAQSYLGLPGVLVEEMPEVLDMTRLTPDLITVFVGEQQIQDVKMFYADTNIFKVLPREILKSESSRIFPDIHSMAISESLARKLYGTVDCLGEKLRLNEGWTFYINTVFEDIPQNSHLCFDVLMSRASLVYYMRHFNNQTGQLVNTEDFEYLEPGPYHRGSWNRRSYNYLLVSEGTDMEWLQEKVVKMLQEVDLPDRIRIASIKPVFHRIDRIHLHSEFPDEMKASGSMFHIYMLILIGVVVVVISWINFMNLYAVVFQEGIRVVAIRMIHGAERKHVRIEVFGKAIFLSLIAAIMAGILAWAVQFFYQAYSFSLLDIVLLLLLTFITAVISVLIPIAGFQSGRIIGQLRGEIFGKQKGALYRRVTVIIQFTASVVLITVTIVVLSQLNYTRKKELGFDPGNIIYSFSPMTMNQRPEIPEKLILFRDKVAGVPGVLDFCVSSTIPGKPIGFPGLTMRFTADGNELESFLQRIHVDAGYFDLYGIEMLAGTGFREDPRYDVEDIVLNRQAAVSLGYADPSGAIGTFLRAGEREYKIIGAVEDYHHKSLKDGLMPMVFFKSLRWRVAVGYYSFRLGSIEEKTIDRLAEIWKVTYPGEQFLFHIMEETYEEQYRTEWNFMRSFMLAALLAMITSSLGLLAFSSYNTLKRTKEIGIRKTFGSSRGRIMILLHMETFSLVMISTLIGIPVAWLIVSRWLTNFSYRIEPSWWMFLVAVLVTLLVATATTFIQTWKISGRNPVESLRYE